MSDHKGARLVLDALPPAATLIAHRGYNSRWFRQALTARGIEPCIPSSKSRKVPSSSRCAGELRQVADRLFNFELPINQRLGALLHLRDAELFLKGELCFAPLDEFPHALAIDHPSPRRADHEGSRHRQCPWASGGDPSDAKDQEQRQGSILAPRSKNEITGR